MLKDITLGQYFPGNSVIHRLDPRTKLIVLVAYIITLFIAKSWITYGLMFAFLVTVIKVSTIPVKSIVRGMKPLVMTVKASMSAGMETRSGSPWKVGITGLPSQT